MVEKPFRYVYTGPGGIDPQTPEEAEAIAEEERKNGNAVSEVRQGADGRRDDIPSQ